MQMYGVLNELMKHHHHTYGIVMGGGNRQAEMKKLFSGVNILVATPGRLLDHMKNPDFMYKHCGLLIIDEADRILDIGFEDEIRQILELLPAYRLTWLFSATQSDKTQALKSLIYKKEPLYIGVGDPKDKATVAGLEQGFVFCEPDQRLRFLYTFLRKKKNKKVMVFFNSCMSVKFHSELLNYINLDNMCIHVSIAQFALVIILNKGFIYSLWKFENE